DAFQDWKHERDAIEREMKLFLAADRCASPQDRGLRQIQFAALIERRNAAVRHLLSAALPPRLPTMDANRQPSTTTRLSLSPRATESATLKGWDWAPQRSKNDWLRKWGAPNIGKISGHWLSSRPRICIYE